MKRIKGAASKLAWLFSLVFLLPPLLVALMVCAFLSWLFHDGSKPEMGYGDGGFYL